MTGPIRIAAPTAVDRARNEAEAVRLPNLMASAGWKIGRGFANSVNLGALTIGRDPDEAVPVPAHPPAEWFEGPPTWIDEWRAEHGLDDDAIPRLVVTDEGRIGGYFFLHGSCLIHDANACPQPSPTGYSAFMQGEVTTAEGDLVRVGVVGNVGGHASPLASIDTAQRRYADPNLQLFVARAGDDERGGWLAGALTPGATWADVALLRRSSLSGDWRVFPPEWFQAQGVDPSSTDGWDFVAPTVVSQPGLPIVRQYRAASADAPPVILGGCGGIALDPSPITAAPSGSTDLPIAPRDRPWDGTAAKARVKAWATNDSGTIDFRRYGRAFFHREGDGDTQGDYSLGFADVIDGTLTAIPRGIFAAANAVQGGRGAEGSRFEDAKGRIAGYYRRMAAQFDDNSITPPWQASAGPTEGAAGVELALADGTRLTIPEGFVLASGTDGLEVRQAAAPEDGPPEPGGLEQRMAALEAKVDELGAVLMELAGGMPMEAAVAAAVDERLAALRLAELAEAPALP